MERTVSGLNSIFYILDERHSAPLVKYCWHAEIDYEPFGTQQGYICLEGKRVASYFYDLEFLEIGIKQDNKHFSEVFEFYNDHFGKPDDVEKFKKPDNKVDDQPNESQANDFSSLNVYRWRHQKEE